MNPYQRIHRGAIRQNGHIDTQAKFKQLTAGVDLRGKSVLDVGCNLGEMCRLAKEAGSWPVRGVDCEPDYIYDARKIAPDDGIVYDCRRAERITGNWDIIIASAMMHYVDIDRTLAQFARCGKMVLCDVWMDDDWSAAVFVESYRGLYVPSLAAWRSVCAKYFGSISERSIALSPDKSDRVVYHLSKPSPSPAKAVLLYGKSHTGKTSRGRDLHYAKGYEHLQLDSIFLSWRMEIEKHLPLSVSAFVDGLWAENSPPRVAQYLKFYRDYLYTWLGARQNLDVVIEGYDAIYPTFRSVVRDVLGEHGWKDVKEMECV